MLEAAFNVLREKFGNRLQENVLLKNYTTMRAGGVADALLIAHDSTELEQFITVIWELELPLTILGSGSNVLVSERGVRGVVLINHAHNIRFSLQDGETHIIAESGALMGKMAKLSINRHLTGLEWAATLPGTVGGAVYGNAGCFGKETADDFIQAEILHPKKGKRIYDKEKMAFEYRSSILKRKCAPHVLLTATFTAKPGNYEESKQMVETYRQRRMKIQPPGPSMGSIFRNPSGDKAGRMIEATGLKGKKIGGAEISQQHANFIINSSNGSADDVWNLINVIQDKVQKKFGIYLHPEIQLIGDWEEGAYQLMQQYQTVQENQV